LLPTTVAARIGRNRATLQVVDALHCGTAEGIEGSFSYDADYSKLAADINLNFETVGVAFFLASSRRSGLILRAKLTKSNLRLIMYKYRTASPITNIFTIDIRVLSQRAHSYGSDQPRGNTNAEWQIDSHAKEEGH
jgi:hypothetical protein